MRSITTVRLACPYLEAPLDEHLFADLQDRGFHRMWWSRRLRCARQSGTDPNQFSSISVDSVVEFAPCAIQSFDCRLGRESRLKWRWAFRFLRDGTALVQEFVRQPYVA